MPHPQPMNASPQDPTLIQDQAALDQLCASAAAFNVLALDTEFENQKTYWPRLALIQVAHPGGLALIDALAGLDLHPLFELLADPSRVIVLYAGQADIELLYHAGAWAWAPVFDVQLGARFLGVPPKGGLGGLARLFLGVEMNKSASVQRSDWCQRPLSPRQLGYAADDVRHLIAVYERVVAVLNESRRAAWAWEEMTTMESPTQYARGPQTRFRVRGPKRRTPLNKALVHEICVWRDALARLEDRPARFILDDRDLNRLAAAAERGEAPLETGLGPQADASLSAALRPTLRGARPKAKGQRRDDGRAYLVDLDLLKQALHDKAEALGVEATLLATHDQLKSFAKHPRESPFTGWRAMIFADWHARWASKPIASPPPSI
ncbi:HRDC domain-containing protein [Myxococcota bacterium]|nr:HRDC domain-containing protein [Myxococcota bacterium]